MRAHWLFGCVSLACSTLGTVGCGAAESYVQTPVRADAGTWNTILSNAQKMNCAAKGPDPVSGLVLSCADGGTIVFGRDQGPDARLVDDEAHYLLEGRCFGSAAQYCGVLVGQLVTSGATPPPGTTLPPVVAPPTATANAGPPPGSSSGDTELAACMPGKTLTTCATSYKVKVPPVEDMGYAFLPQFGLEFKMEDDGSTIHALFIHFFSKKEGAYTKTFRGIGKDAKERDIFAEFGHPTDVTDTVVSQYGEYPGANDHSIVYDGYRFTFYDDKLALIAVFPPEAR